MSWLPATPPLLRPLPGIAPLPQCDWLIRDAAFNDQMAVRDRLLHAKPAAVVAMTAGADAAAAELLQTVLNALDEGYVRDGDTIRRPDGIAVPVDRTAQLLTIGRLVQSDFCLMAPDSSGSWQLRAAVLCFPAFWRLDQKIGCGMGRIHSPVPEFDQMMGQRVDRLFHGVRSDQPLWRYNLNLHETDALFLPRAEEDAPVALPPLDSLPFLRSERQTLRRLPDTGWVVFGIHTAILPVTLLTGAQQAGLAELRGASSES